MKPQSRRPAKPRRAPVPTETQEHETIASWYRKIGGLGGNAVMYHTRNERAGDWQRIQAHKMLILPGVPDFTILDGNRIGYIELKVRGWRQKKLIDRTSKLDSREERQLETHNLLRRAGAWVEICETLEEVIAALVAHGVPVRSSDIVTEALRKYLPAAMAIPPLAETIRDLPDDTLDLAIDDAANA